MCKYTVTGFNNHVVEKIVLPNDSVPLYSTLYKQPLTWQTYMPPWLSTRYPAIMGINNYLLSPTLSLSCSLYCVLVPWVPHLSVRCSRNVPPCPINRGGITGEVALMSSLRGCMGPSCLPVLWFTAHIFAKTKPKFDMRLGSLRKYIGTHKLLKIAHGLKWSGVDSLKLNGSPCSFKETIRKNKGCILASRKVYLKVWNKELAKAILATPCIVNNGESIFDHEYFLEFESKIIKAISIGYGTYSEPNCIIKKRQTHLIGMSLWKHYLSTSSFVSSNRRQTSCVRRVHSSPIFSVHKSNFSLVQELWVQFRGSYSFVVKLSASCPYSPSSLPWASTPITTVCRSTQAWVE
jgi:hypothetical protein